MTFETIEPDALAARMRQTGQDTKFVRGIHKTYDRRARNPKTGSKSQRYWMLCRPTLDRLWFPVNRAQYLAVRRQSTCELVTP